MPTISISTHEDSNKHFMVQPTVRSKLGLIQQVIGQQNTDINY